MAALPTTLHVAYVCTTTSDPPASRPRRFGRNDPCLRSERRGETTRSGRFYPMLWISLVSCCSPSCCHHLKLPGPCECSSISRQTDQLITGPKKKPTKRFWIGCSNTMLCKTAGTDFERMASGDVWVFTACVCEPRTETINIMRQREREAGQLLSWVAKASMVLVVSFFSTCRVTSMFCSACF